MADNAAIDTFQQKGAAARLAARALLNTIDAAATMKGTKASATAQLAAAQTATNAAIDALETAVAALP